MTALLLKVPHSYHTVCTGVTGAFFSCVFSDRQDSVRTVRDHYQRPLHFGTMHAWSFFDWAGMASIQSLLLLFLEGLPRSFLECTVFHTTNNIRAVSDLRWMDSIHRIDQAAGKSEVMSRPVSSSLSLSSSQSFTVRFTDAPIHPPSNLVLAHNIIPHPTSSEQI
jgi:hypothetical protein